MDNCPICDTGRTITKVSSAGDETYCVDCRRIVASATFDFKFSSAEEQVTACQTADNQPGFKGPGKKAKCWPYVEGNKDSETKAKQKAKDSAYAFQHARGASKIVNALAYFTGGPSSVTDGPMQPGDNPSNPLGFGAQSNPMPPTSHPGKSPMQTGALRSGGSGANGEVPAAPGGIQPGELNGANPANSGTTASKITPKLADLISKEIFGVGHCTAHNCSEDECKPLHELH